MANGLLGAIANPQMADIGGAFQRREILDMQRAQFEQKQAERAKQQQINQAINDIYAQRFTGKLADLSKLDAASAIQVAKETGIPFDQEGRLKHWFGTAQVMDTLMKEIGPQAALDFLNTERAFLADKIPTPRMDAFALKLQNDPAAAAADLAALNKAGQLKGVLKSPEQFTLAEGAKRFDVTGQQIAENIKAKAANLEFADFRSLNNDVTKMIEPAIEVKQAADALGKLKETATASDQMAGIITFMKALDPSSVVQEREGQMVVSTGGLSDQMIGFVNQLMGEGRLREGVFKQLVDTARSLTDSRINGIDNLLTGALDAYGDRLSTSDRDKLLKRIPTGFGPREQETFKPTLVGIRSQPQGVAPAQPIPPAPPTQTPTGGIMIPNGTP